MAKAVKARNLKIENVALKSLKPAPQNARFHSLRNLDDIGKSIKKFGWTNPMIVRKKDKTIIAGNGRYAAAIREGIETGPVIFVDMSDQDAKLYSVADNRVGDTSTWNLTTLKDLFVEFKDWDGVSLDVTGFQDQEWDQLFGSTTVASNEQEYGGGMPEFVNDDLKSLHLTMHFATEADLEDFGRLNNQPVNTQTRYLWHPPEEKMDNTGRRFEDES